MFDSESIAERLRCSRNDVSLIVALIECIDTDKGPRREKAQETRDAIAAGDDSGNWRKWRAAVSGKLSGKGGKAKADFRQCANRGVTQLVTAFEGWGKIGWENVPGKKYASRDEILAKIRRATEIAPPEARAEMIEAIGETWSEHEKSELYKILHSKRKASK
jgi:hypothetical protein